jgi:hypothetical protein
VQSFLAKPTISEQNSRSAFDEGNAKWASQEAGRRSLRSRQRQDANDLLFEFSTGIAARMPRWRSECLASFQGHFVGFAEPVNGFPALKKAFARFSVWP